MLVCEILGGNEVNGFKEGIVVVDGEKLPLTYTELVKYCGNISLGEIDTHSRIDRRTTIYAKQMVELDAGSLLSLDDAKQIITENHLTAHVCYSSYAINWENKTFTLEISTYDEI